MAIVPKFEIVEITSNRFQINEIWPTCTIFVGIRETKLEAKETVVRMKQEYDSYGRLDI